MTPEKKKKTNNTGRERERGGEKKSKGANEKYEHFFKSQNTA
jgi:hypothetical protein